jgi:hypothetical protein
MSAKPKRRAIVIPRATYAVHLEQKQEREEGVKRVEDVWEKVRKMIRELSTEKGAK